jgi:hypothetical protein
MRRALAILILAVCGIVGIFAYSNMRPGIHAVSAACRQERLQGLTCLPSALGLRRESLIG